ncbi:acyltransferase family protein [Streptomyces sp. NPDC012746]|uniref:acyltransferase family protein n=1 Tax=Streptomyces sp. NPDC012746 TaxID=3364845 RepID=UPI0036CD9BFF
MSGSPHPSPTKDAPAKDTPREAPPVPAHGGRLYTLDGLRLVAALMVVAFHYIGFNNWSSPIWGAPTPELFPVAHYAAAYGWLGVQLFFLISGFVICMSSWGRSLRQFAVSRVSRLYPAYWFAVLLTSGVLVLTYGEDSGIDLGKFLANLTMFQELMGIRDIDPVYWTLWTEMRFYLLFAIVAAFGLTYRRVVAFCAVWLALAMWVPYSGIAWLRLWTVPDAAPYFIAGIVMYLMHRFRPNPVLWVLLAASWLVAKDQLSIIMRGGVHSTGHTLLWRVSLAIITVFFLLVLTVALGGLKSLNRRWLATAGALTFPLYLLHEILGWELIRAFHDTMPPWVLITLLVTLFLGASWLVQRYIERPVAKALKKWLGPAPRAGARPAQSAPMVSVRQE